MSTEKYQGRKYLVQSYDPNWVAQYEVEESALRRTLGGNILSIEHVGSTSVPGLAGKPLIDILVVVKNIEEADRFEPTLSSLGYDFLGQYVMEGSRLYVKEKDNTRLVNLHFFKQGHKHICEMIGLRDYFRSHPEVVKGYSQLKFDLFEKYPDDYGSYRKYKDDWVNELKAKLGLV
ncbi:MAG: GrpB family protein [Candidatus Paceibacterota bacterium]